MFRYAGGEEGTAAPDAQDGIRECIEESVEASDAMVDAMVDAVPVADEEGAESYSNLFIYILNSGKERSRQRSRQRTGEHSNSPEPSGIGRRTAHVTAEPTISSLSRRPTKTHLNAPRFKRLTTLLPLQNVMHPGCCVPCIQCCGYLDLAKLLTNSPVS
jgi:hypothetical protein